MREAIFRSGLSAGNVNRRRLLRGAARGAAGLTIAAGLAACGGGKSTSDSGASGPSARPAGPVGAPTGLPWPYTFPEPAKAAKSGGILKIAADWDVSILDPVKTAAGGTIVKDNLVYNRLISYKTGPDADPFKFEMEGELATSWEQPEPSRYVFRLAPGIRYQNLAPVDGRDFGAEDIKYAYERFAKEGVHTAYFEQVERITPVDARTLEITLKQPSPDFLVPLGTRYLTIFPRELVEQGTIEKVAVGTGPMILKEMVKSDHVTLEKFAGYWRSKVLLDGMEFRIMPDANSRLAAFRAGQVDYAYRLIESKRDMEELLKTNPNTQVNLNPIDSDTFTIALNLENAKFQDERVRQAVMLAMDRDAIIEVLYGKGFAESLPTIPWDFVLDKPPSGGELGRWWRYDPAEAKKLLAAAGAGGLSFTVTYHEYRPTGNTRTLEILADQFRQAGITMQVQRIDYTEYNSQWIGRSFKEATHGWKTLGFEADTYFYNHVHSKSPGNRWRISDPQLDEWAVKQRTEMDPGSRRAIHRQIWDRLLDKAYRIETPEGLGFQPYQPWLRGARFGGARGSNSNYYDWGQQIHRMWLDR